MASTRLSLAFVTGCLEPGRDGVGDYTRTLAAECVRLGHRVGLLSLGEPGPVPVGASDGLPSLRLTSGQWRGDGGRTARRWLESFAPDWTCLQFVPYSFDPRGLFGKSVGPLAELLRTAPRRSVFFHEVWIGSQAGAPMKSRAIGWWQRRAVADLLRRLDPGCVHTSAGYHQAVLADLGWRAALLPMFGSVPRIEGAAVALRGVPVGAMVCGHFGTLHPNWVADDFLADLSVLAASKLRPAALVAVGSLGPGEALFQTIAEAEEGRIACMALGRLNPEALSQTFSRFDFGVTSVPWNLRGKSSSAAALREHGLRVVVTAGGNPPRCAREYSDFPADDGFVPYFSDRTRLGSALEKTAPRPGVATAAEMLLNDLNAAS